jgi:tRNA 2-thiouridine synthesizing protein D
MRYAIKVNQSERCPEISRIARDFIRALTSEGHEVIRVFFYHDGVFEGFSSSCSDWVDLANKGRFELILCSQALDHRRLGLDVQLPFVVGGLALWIDACLKADRVLSFGGPYRGA